MLETCRNSLFRAPVGQDDRADRDDARLVLNKDPDLKGSRGDPLRVLLYLFQRDMAVKYLRSG